MGGAVRPHPYSIPDGLEVNGSYCFAVGANPCANEAHPLLPLNADSNGDGQAVAPGRSPTRRDAARIDYIYI